MLSFAVRCINTHKDYRTIKNQNVLIDTALVIILCEINVLAEHSKNTANVKRWAWHDPPGWLGVQYNLRITQSINPLRHVVIWWASSKHWDTILNWIYPYFDVKPSAGDCMHSYFLIKRLVCTVQQMKLLLNSNGVRKSKRTYVYTCLFFLSWFSIFFFFLSMSE